LHLLLQDGDLVFEPPRLGFGRSAFMPIRRVEL